MSSAERERIFFDFDRWGWDAKGWSHRTRYGYGYRVRAADEMIRTLYGRFVVWANYDMLEEHLFSLPTHPRNRNHARQALVGFFEFCKHRKLVKANPAIDLPILKVARLIPKALPAGQMIVILEAARIMDLRDQALVYTYAFTAMRRDEVRELEWRRLDEDPGWIRIQHGKGDKERRIAVHPILARVLRRWRVKSGNPELVFPSPYNPQRPISTTTVQSTLRKVGNMAGVEGLHAHLFRHTMATQLLDQGTHIRTLQEILGHANLQTTATYLRVRPANVKRDMLSLDYRASTTASSPVAPSA